MKRIIQGRAIFLILTVFILIVVFVSGTPADSAASGDDLFAQGETEFNSSNFHTAMGLFSLAKENYAQEGDHDGFIRARDMAFLSTAAGMAFPYNQSEIEAEMAMAFPDVTEEQRNLWLSAPMTATIESEGEIWYFSDTIHNVKNHYPALLREENARNNHTPLYDELMPLITASWGDDTQRYGDPVTFTGSTSLDIPRSELPENGTLKVWMPVPVESGSQTNVSILSIMPEQYLKSSTGTDADIGLVYLEIPVDEIQDPSLSIKVRYRFDQHEQRFEIDPKNVQPYNTSSHEFQRYTGSSKNIAITPDIIEKARSIVVDETNPYLQAEMIYWDIVNTHPYSHAPHVWLDAIGMPESQYVHDTGIGDCASQSYYFAALCRSIGIPARATGGYQMIDGSAGTHIWAEFYLEGYGWIPVDVTAAEGGDTSFNATEDDLLRYKAYFFGNLDPYRFIIQKSLDLPVVPDAGDAVIPPFGWVQVPKLVCDTCTENPMALSYSYSNISVTRE